MYTELLGAHHTPKDIGSKYISIVDLWCWYIRRITNTPSHVIAANGNVALLAAAARTLIQRSEVQYRY